MKRIYLMMLLLGLLAIGAQAQVPERDSENGPVIRLTYYEIKPGKGAEYIKFLREHTKPILDEQKKQGLILDWNYLSQPTNNGAGDWDVAQAIMFKTYAEALDYDEERARKFNEIGLKHYGSAEARTKANNSLNEMRDVVGVHYLRVQRLLPLPVK